MIVRALCAAVAVGALCPSAFAQSRGTPRQPHGSAQAELAALGLDVRVELRAAAAGGDAIDPGVGTPPVEYSDLFGTGTGGGVTVGMPWYLREFGDRRVELAIGPLLAFDNVRFPGRRHTDLAGDSLDADALDITSVLAGFHLRLRIGRVASPVKFLLGAHLGYGAAFLGEVDAMWEPVGGPAGPVALYDATTASVFELGFRIGISGQPARSVDLDLVASLGLRVVGAPDDPAGGPAALQPRAEPMLQGTFGIALSITLRFPGGPRGPAPRGRYGRPPTRRFSEPLYR